MENLENIFFSDWRKLIEDFEAFTKSADNPFFKSKYVPLKVILPVVKEKCHKHNFLFMQFPVMVDGKSCLRTKIVHLNGDVVEGTIELAHKPEDPQKLGASITYMRRYSLTCMFGLEEDDDDGNTASGKQDTRKEPMMGFETGKKLNHLIKILNVDIDKWEKQIGKKITQFTVKEVNYYIKELEAKLTPEQRKKYESQPF